MYRSTRWLMSICLLCTGTGLVFGQDAQPPASIPATPTPQEPDPAPVPEGRTPPLMMGDPAPRLAPATWVRGEPVMAFEPGMVYVVEFWATWCEPCQKSIPLLTRLQRKYKDKAVVIGVSVWEKTTREFNVPDEEFLPRVKAFVEDRRDTMDYRVAYDGVAGEMARTWMDAAKRVGIPSAFIVDRAGRLAWIGNPLQPEGAMERALALVVDGTWDTAREREAMRQREETERKGNALAKHFSSAMEKSDWREVERLAEEMLRLDPTRFASVAPAAFEILLTQTRETDKAYAFARRVTEGPLAQNPGTHNDLAWIIVTAHGVETRDTALALSLARKACELTQEKDGRTLDTLARVHAERLEYKEAYAASQKAVAALGPDVPAETREEIVSRLEQYRARAGVGPE